jgi:hypothetical protein
MSATTIVTTEAGLNAAIVNADTLGNQGAITIKIAAGISLGSPLEAINPAFGNTVTIEGTNSSGSAAEVQTLIGGTQRGLFVYTGTVTIENLALDDMTAQGGAGSDGGGGGAGLGGGLFVAGGSDGEGGAKATLVNVSFLDDSAVGGKGGSGYGGGGGGLGGAGVSGGGGIGASATGGGFGGGVGHAGIVPEEPDALTGSSGEPGGPSGGGGGGAAPNFGTGGGGGIPGSAGGGGANAGYGGGGGGCVDLSGAQGGKGGFGGGGGSGNAPGGIFMANGGAGGFGGGGGGFAADEGGSGGGGGGGFGGGAGASGGGGGGLGAGGDIFVQPGATVIIEGGSLAGEGANLDDGGAGGGSAGGGAFYGSGIFLQGNETITLAPGTGQTLTIAGVIADENGSTGASGAGALVMDGLGMVVLDADNTFTGGISISSGTVALAATGAAGGGPISGAGTLALTGGIATFSPARPLTVAHLTQSAGSTAGVDAAVAYAGDWTQSGGSLDIAFDDKASFSGTNSFSGTLDGLGTIAFTGGADTLSGTTVSVTYATVSGATVALVGAISLTDTLVAASPKIVIGAAGATLAGGGRLELTNAATNLVLGVSATTTLTNDDVIFGAGDLGDGQMTLDNAAKGIIEGDDSVALTINTGTKTILNAGDIVAVTALTIDSGVDNTGELLADGGTLTVQEAVTGAGHADVEGAGTLILKSAFNENVTFASGSTGTLELGDSKGYTTGAVTGFSKTGANALDLLDIPFVSGTTTATYSGTTTSGVLTVKDGANVATIHLTGNYTTSTFTVSSSSAGGTKVVDPAQPSAPPHVAAPLSPHPFIAAMAGFGAMEAGAAALDGALWGAPPPTLAMPRTQTA